MNRNDQYLSYAADCQQMTCMTRNEHERQVWLDMAQSWLKLVQLPHARLRPSSIPVGSATPRSSRLGAFRQVDFVQTTHRARSFSITQAANKFAASHGRQLHQATPKDR